MWCTEVAAAAFMTFLNVVSGDIGDHGRSSSERQTLRQICFVGTESPIATVK